ncbi:MAG: histidinol dehydrogenase [Clostridia bacterium]|nr:histidinol dehydrogenase [Clostridia bacterium]
MIKIYDINEISQKDILLRATETPDVSATVAEIIAAVRKNGDRALKEYSKKFDGAALKRLEVTDRERREAMKYVDPKFVDILKEAAENIRAFHQCQKRTGYMLERRDGVILGQKITPLVRVGLYIPGGTASYPSTVLMNCIPAKIAGVSEIIMTTPPDKNSCVSPNIIAAAEIAGVDRIIKCGGAQAVAALAYGTKSVPRVDKIVGPGNVFVAEAKRQVYGVVDIDMIAGPSEILVVADEKSDPVLLAADMLSQAEHDKLATAVLVTPSKKLANAVSKQIEAQLKVLPREEIARSSVENNGKIILCGSIEQAIDISNAIAPEHLELCVDEPFEYLNLIKNAGSIFLGRNCPEALGDYFAGTNHTLPTGGRARFSSPLSVDDFIKKSSYMFYTRDALNADAGKIAVFAEEEGLSGHARSAVSRSK